MPSDIENTQNFKDESLEPDASASTVTRRRITIFLVVIPVILLSANLFVCATWNHFWKIRGIPAWEIIPPVLTLTFIASMFLGRRHSSLGLRLAYGISVIWLGFLNFSFFAACAAWIVLGIAALVSFQIEPKFIAAFFFAGAVLASIYGVWNASWLRVTRVTVKLENLPSPWFGRTAALVTDMHLGNVRGVGFTRRVVAKLQQLQPEVVFIAGDMFDGVKADLDALVEPWKKLSTRAGVYYVSGNHEEFEDRRKFLDAVKGTGIRVLNNEKVEIDGLQIVGVHDRETDDPAIFKALLQRAGLDRNRACILLAHRPANLAIPAAEGISLQLSGHTHGGQIWPWHKLAARVHGKFVHGLNQFERMQVFTSYGAGTWGVPMRVWTKSEIVLIRFETTGNAEDCG